MAADRYSRNCRLAVSLGVASVTFAGAGLATGLPSHQPRALAAAAVLPVAVPARSSQLVATPSVQAGYGEPRPHPVMIDTHAVHQHHLAIVAARTTPPAPVPSPAVTLHSVPAQPAAAPVQSSAPVTAAAPSPSASSAKQTGPAGSGAGAGLLAKAMTMQGVPYVYGGDTPGGFDCSGLVYWAAQQLGITGMPRDTYGMLGQGVSSGLLVQVSSPSYGDLAFFGSGHVEFWVKPGETFGAQSPGTSVGYHPYGGGYAPSEYFRVT